MRAGTSKSLCHSPPPDMRLLALSLLTSYLYRHFDASFSWWSTPLEGEPASHHILCQNVALFLRCLAASFQPGTRDMWELVAGEVSAKRTDKCSQRDKSRADPSENDAEHRLDQCSQSNQQVLMEDNWLSEHNSSADLSLYTVVP